jgi:hypothetical protein
MTAETLRAQRKAAAKRRQRLCGSMIKAVASDEWLVARKADGAALRDDICGTILETFHGLASYQLLQGNIAQD